jgi:hypothetical protein
VTDGPDVEVGHEVVVVAGNDEVLVAGATLTVAPGAGWVVIVVPTGVAEHPAKTPRQADTAMTVMSLNRPIHPLHGFATGR